MPRKDGTPHPSQDRNLPHEGRIFYKGAWRTPEQREQYMEQSRAYQKGYWQREWGTNPEFRLKETQRLRHKRAKLRKETRLAEDKTA